MMMMALKHKAGEIHLFEYSETLGAVTSRQRAAILTVARCTGRPVRMFIFYRNTSIRFWSCSTNTYGSYSSHSGSPMSY